MLLADIAPNFIAEGDFYSRSAVLDLLFHPRETSYSIPEVAELLAEHGLRLALFDANAEVLEMFKEFDEQGVLQGTDLEKWDMLEKDFEGIFGAMYQFWAVPTRGEADLSEL